MKLIPLSRGLFAKVNDEDFEDLSKFNWTIKTSKKERSFYAKRSILKGKSTESMHRRIMKAKKGDEVDHVDHDGLNNQKSNLRICNHYENMRNRRSQKSSTNKYIGVTEYRGKFLARIWHQDKTITIGLYEDIIEAAEARDLEALRLRGQFAKLNFTKGFRPVGNDKVKVFTLKDDPNKEVNDSADLKSQVQALKKKIRDINE
jgi:phage-related protein